MAFLVAMHEEIEGTFDLGRWTPAESTPYEVYVYTDRDAGNAEAEAGAGTRARTEASAGDAPAAVIVHTGIGTTNAAAAAQFVLDRYAPRRVVNVGLVGCLDAGIGIGTVHAVSTCAFFDVDATVFGYRIGQIPRTSVHEYGLVSRVDAVPPARLITGNTFVTDSGAFHPDLAGFEPALVDMELAAIAHTLYRNGALVRLESYKAPSDYCNVAATGAFEENMPKALEALAAVADRVLRDATGPGRGRGRRQGSDRADDAGAAASAGADADTDAGEPVDTRVFAAGDGAGALA